MAAPRLVYLVTHPVSADLLLKGQLAYLRERGFDVTVVSSPGPELTRVREREGVRVVPFEIPRQMDPARDLVALGRLVPLLRSLRPDIVNASTPKAGLLGMLAARAIAAPVRIYLLRGLRLETTRGAVRKILSGTERVASFCAHEVVCVSRSLRDAATRGGHLAGRRGVVLGEGSSNGVDAARFERTPERVARGRELARAVGIADEDEVIGFIGRLDADKGIADLLDAFRKVRSQRPRARLLFVGGGFADDHHEPLAARIREEQGVVAYGKTDEVAPLVARMAVLAFPSLREGFPNVPLEAASACVPAVGYRSTGVVDAIRDGETGAIVDQHDVPALAAELTRYLEDDGHRAAHGAAARARVLASFTREIVWGNWERYYREHLERVASRR